jgi:hypothetical protein
MADVDRVTDIIETTFTQAVERCEFDEVVGVEGTTVDVPSVSRLAAQALDELGLLS